MTYAGGTSIERGLPAVLGFLRAISGLVAIIALLAIVAGAIRLVESGDSRRVAAPAAAGASAAEPARQTPIIRRSRPAQPETMVFYLVATPEQEYQADWGENVEAFDYTRHYRVLYARDEAELQAAQQTVMEYMLATSERSSVQLIDFRNGP